MPEVYLEDLRFNFNYLTKKMFTKSGMSFMVHSAAENKDLVLGGLKKLVERLRKGFNHFDVPSQFMEDESEFTFDTKKEFHVLPNYINYCARAYKAPHYLHPDAPRLQMAGGLTRKTDCGRVPAPADPGEGRGLRVRLPLQLRRQSHHEHLPRPQHPQILREL